MNLTMRQATLFLLFVSAFSMLQLLDLAVRHVDEHALHAAEVVRAVRFGVRALVAAARVDPGRDVVAPQLDALLVEPLRVTFARARRIRRRAASDRLLDGRTRRGALGRLGDGKARHALRVEGLRGHRKALGDLRQRMNDDDGLRAARFDDRRDTIVTVPLLPGKLVPCTINHAIDMIRALVPEFRMLPKHFALKYRVTAKIGGLGRLGRRWRRGRRGRRGLGRAAVVD